MSDGFRSQPLVVDADVPLRRHRRKKLAAADYAGDIDQALHGFDSAGDWRDVAVPGGHEWFLSHARRDTEHDVAVTVAHRHELAENTIGHEVPVPDGIPEPDDF